MLARLYLIPLAAGLAASAFGAQHAHSAAACVPGSVAPPAAFANWTNPAAPPAAGLPLGRAVRLMLATGVRLAGNTAEPRADAGHAAAVPLTVTRAGDYRIALSDKAWLDVVAGGRALASVAHGHGPDCSGVRKIVTFRLTPGRYMVEISRAESPVITVAIAAAETASGTQPGDGVPVPR